MLKETSLVNVHRQMSGKLVDFGGWNMPVNYGSQIEEHTAVREAAGMFDVSHMTIVDVEGGGAKSFLQYLLANDVGKLQQPGKALYTAMLNPEGGVIDDLIVYLMSFGYRLVVNCATREKDLAWLAQHSAEFEVSICERHELAMIAVQGPQARERVHGLLEPALIEGLGLFQGAFLAEPGRAEWFVARTGYTGEEGYEIMLPNSDAPAFWQALADVGVKPCGLGARDTLRLEAGMNLYGHEMDEQTSPLVANMGWTVAWPPESRNFIGREKLEQEKATGVRAKLVGLLLHGKGVLREGQVVTGEDEHGVTLQGIVTSGTFSPTLGHSIALARVPMNFSENAVVEVRKRALAVTVVKPCFVRNGRKVV